MKRVLYFFKKISEIPRASGNEKAVADYIEGFARKLKLETYRDEMHNLIIYKNASPGYEERPPVIIQGHTDIVAEKNADCKHNFAADPLTLITEGDSIKAVGTTLGADNGIAVAYAMALLEGDYKHPPLEIVLTSKEETGMQGAMFLDASKLKGKRLINLDDETEGNFIVSCAGGVRSSLRIPLKCKKLRYNRLAAILEIKGLKGGHSGTEAKSQRANAIVLMGRLLNALTTEYKFELFDFAGGLKDNAIPREARAYLYINTGDLSGFKKLAAKTGNILKNEYKDTDPDMKILFRKIKTTFAPPVSKKSLQRIISALLLIPNGVYFYGGDIDKTPETSSNAGVAFIVGDEFIIQSCVRSSVNSRKEWLREKLSRLALALGGYETAEGDYPAWEYNEESELRDVFTRTYREMYGKEPNITAIHAGLECGVFTHKIKGADTIAIGPDITGAHSPDEEMSLPSAKRVWEFLLQALSNL